MAVAHSGVARPSVAAVRATLGDSGPTNLLAWEELLAAYHVPYQAVRTRWDLEAALWDGKVIVAAAWMGALSPGPDYNRAGTPEGQQVGRYVPYGAGHAILIVGIADGGANYLVHDPDTFAGPTSSYADGSPKGRYRRSSADEVWADIAHYAGALSLAVGRVG